MKQSDRLRDGKLERIGSIYRYLVSVETPFNFLLSLPLECEYDESDIDVDDHEGEDDDEDDVVDSHYCVVVGNGSCVNARRVHSVVHRTEVVEIFRGKSWTPILIIGFHE